jgi:hypothetical protein
MQAIDGILHGGCLCGAIRYMLRGPALFISQCCCKDCQKATGTGHTTIVGVQGGQLQITQGTPKAYRSRGDSGGDVVRHFCSECGGRLYTSGTLPGTIVMVQAGSLDDPNRISPESVIYAKDALSWDRFDEALPRFPGLPDRGQEFAGRQ